MWNNPAHVRKTALLFCMPRDWNTSHCVPQVRAEAEAAAAAAKIAEERAGRERAEAMVGQRDQALGAERSARLQAEQGQLGWGVHAAMNWS